MRALLIIEAVTLLAILSISIYVYAQQTPHPQLRGIIEIDCPPKIIVRLSNETYAKLLADEIGNVIHLTINSIPNGIEAVYVLGTCSYINVSKLRVLNISIEGIASTCFCSTYRVYRDRIEILFIPQKTLVFLGLALALAIANLVISRKIAVSSRRKEYVCIVLMIVALATCLAYVVIATLLGCFCCLSYPFVVYILVPLNAVNMFVPLFVAFFMGTMLAVSIPSIVYGVKAFKSVRMELKQMASRERAFVKELTILIVVPVIVFVALYLSMIFILSINPLIALAIGFASCVSIYELIAYRLCRSYCRFTKVDGIDVCILDTRGALAMQIGMFRRFIVLSEDLVRVLNDDELRAVVTHEYAHMKGLHLLLNEFAYIVVIGLAIALILNLPSYIENMQVRVYVLVALSLISILAPLTFSRMIGRFFESRADRYAQQKAGAKALAKALVKIVYLSKRSIDEEDLAEKIFKKVIDSHPPLRKRIAVLTREEVSDAIREVEEKLRKHNE